MEAVATSHTTHGEGPAPPPPYERRSEQPPAEEPAGGLPTSARFYLAAVYGIGCGAVLATYIVGPWSAGANDLVAFGIFTLFATVSQLFMVDAPNRQSYHATPAFLLAGAYLLDPVLLVPMVVISLIPEWIKYRYPWYIQTFNIATYMLNALAAAAAFHALAPDGISLTWGAAAAVGAAGVTFGVLNHAMVALVLYLARGITARDSGIFSRESLETDMSLLGVGTGMAIFWSIEPALIVIEIVPLFLFYRALFVPKLRDEAHHDPKTGLLVARRFNELLREEADRAVRTRRPLSVLMADLDLFRNVNNNYGHMAGDEVLKAVAHILRETLRGVDEIARFGGEEFVVILRNTDAAGATAVAERVREAMEVSDITISSVAEPVHLTMSLGVASYPDPCEAVDNLMHQADRAVYRSKLAGRNRVTLARPLLEDVEAPDEQYRGIMESLAYALDARGTYVDGRTMRVTAITLTMARELGVEEASAEWRVIEQACLLHDLGALAISSTVLYKDGPLSPEEWAQMRMHPEIGWSMMSQVEMLKPAATIVRAHHEHFDGSGYPHGLAGRDIPLGARIIAVSDAYDAITSDRPYRAAQPEATALAEIRKHRGTQFDPAVVDALIKVIGRRKDEPPKAEEPLATSAA